MNKSNREEEKMAGYVRWDRIAQLVVWLTAIVFLAVFVNPWFGLLVIFLK